ncbi:hypothetical protein [Bacillus glycinifermentans]|uniref:hypothetical protein n=1 Tax=Bacillus glycinifermentans TaxID=1664069 RepID=UPI0022E24BEB|nr:hypothetical protein [Bacillus glycinifermentans]
MNLEDYKALQESFNRLNDSLNNFQTNTAMQLRQTVEQLEETMDNAIKTRNNQIWQSIKELSETFEKMETAKMEQIIQLGRYFNNISLNIATNMMNNLYSVFQNINVKKFDIAEIDLTFIDELSNINNNQLGHDEHIKEAEVFIQEECSENDLTAEDINQTIEKANSLSPSTKFHVFQAIAFFLLMVIYVQVGGEATLGINFQEFVEAYMGITAIGAVTKSPEEDNRE